MKINLSLLLIATVLSLTWVGCKWNAHGEPTSEDSVLLTDSSEKSDPFKDEMSVYESADRVIWQKPDLVIQELGDVDGKVVADIGAGTGYFSRRIAYKGAKVIAIDIDPKAIQWMEEQKARFPIELQDRLVIRQAEPDDPKLKAQEVDLVLLVNTYSYISNRIPYFTRLKEAIRPGGDVIIIDFKKKETPFGPAIEERVDVADVEKELKEAGYTLLKIDQESLEYQYIIKARRI
ncbi:MAG: class I SAM-dependent methyltransferase [Saprospiraceae bacterium]|nr:class I SAM-dependent methyltransferase [Saprospiraceae bacterium]